MLLAFCSATLAIAVHHASIQARAQATNAAIAPEAPDSAQKPSGGVLDTNWGVGSWIWAAETHDKQFCRLWRSFKVPASVPVTRAKIRVTADNGFRLMLDGRELGRGSDWRSLTEYDVSQLLSPGTHVLAVEAFNDRLEAGVLFGLRIELADGSVTEIGSDGSWRVAPDAERGWETRRHALPDWPAAVVVGAFGAPPRSSMPYGVTTLPPFHPIVLRPWQTGWFQIALSSVCGVALIVCLRLMLQLGLQSKAQQLLQRERERIARDLHDDLGSGLTQLVLQGEVTQSELPEASETRSQINQFCDRARELARGLDEVIWAVNSRRDTLRDFATYVSKYAREFLQTTPIRCRLDIEMGLAPLPFDLPIRRNLFLAVKEALNNAVKHSGANELFLRIHREAAGLRVEVEDNGRGFEPSTTSGAGNGLANMSQRLGETGGQCRLFSAPGQGCRIEFTIPRLHVRLPRRWSPWRRARVQAIPRSDNPNLVSQTSTARPSLPSGKS